MKIAYVAPEYYPAIGGVGQVVRELATRQAKAGHEVHVFVPAWDKEKPIPEGTEVIDGVIVHRCKYYFKLANFSTVWPSVFTKLRKGKFDIIHSHLFAHPHYVFAGLAARLSGAKHIHTSHCPWSDAHRSVVGRMGVILSYNLVSKAIAKYATDAFITITTWENKYFTRFGASLNKMINIPNGMADIFFKKVTKNSFKKKHNIKGKMVLFFGRLSETKRPDNFVRIAKKVLAKRNDVTFVVRGPDEGYKQRVIDAIGDEKKIMLLPETRDRNEVAAMYQAADMYVLPSYREGLPLTLFEAMASELPLVASPVNGVPYEIKDPDNGFLIKWDDLDSFAERIGFFLDNPKKAKAIGEHNKKYAQRYNWDVIEQETMELYKRVLAGKNVNPSY